MSDKKYLGRSMPVISRESYNVERAPRLPNWMDEFATNLEKQSVESKTRADKSIYHQISSIMGNKSKYSSVEDAVNDMKERSGMKDFLNKLKSEGHGEVATKIADCAPCGEDKEIHIFKSVPQVKHTVDNYIEDTNGNLPIPAIVEKIKSIHKNDISEDSDWDESQFLHYLNDKNIEVKKMHPSNENDDANLGKRHNYSDDDIDPSNDDALHALTPAVVSK